jgi:hypothetical protein
MTALPHFLSLLGPESMGFLESKVANVGNGIESTGKCSVAPLSTTIGSFVTIGERPVSLRSAIRAIAGAAAAPAVLAAIGCACPRDRGAHMGSEAGAGLPSIGLGMDSSIATSLGSAAGVGSFSSSSAE